MCVQDSIFVMDINTEERHQIIKALGPAVYVQPARNRMPHIYLHDFGNGEDIELQDVRCGHFGLPVKFSRDKSRVLNCTGHYIDNPNECNLCSLFNATTYPSFWVVDRCIEYLIAKPKNTFLHAVNCPDGYYRIEYDYLNSDNKDACFSLRIFEEPIPVEEIENLDVVESYCNGTIMQLTSADDIFIFKELSKKAGLHNQHHCLFSLFTNELLKYSDWDRVEVSKIRSSLNWDATMNYAGIINGLSYLASKANGQWTWADDTVSCIVCMVESPIPLPQLQLKYNILERALEVEVTHEDVFIRHTKSAPGFMCHARIPVGEIFRYVTNLTLFPISDSRDKYLLENVGKGIYWCNGHNVIKRRYVGSNETFAYGIEFAFQVVRKCFTRCSFNAKDLNKFVDVLTENYGFLVVKESAFIENEITTSDRHYTFSALLSLTLNDNVTINLDTNLMNLTEYEKETIFIYEQLKKMPLSKDSNYIYFQSIRSTEYCLYESTLSMDAIIWGIGKIGETISPSKLLICESNNEEIHRTCFDENLWQEGTSDCHTFVSESLLELYVNISSSNSNKTSEVIEHLKAVLEENIEILQPLDVFLTSRILQKIENVTFNDLENILSIYDSLLQIDEYFLEISSFYNSTNILLEALDNIILSHIEYSISNNTDYEKYGKVTLHSPFIETFIVDPRVSEISGIVLYRPKNSNISDDDFTNYSTRYINPKETIYDLMVTLTENYLVVGSYLPIDMLNNSKITSVVMTVFFDDKLFKSFKDSTEKGFFRTNEKIISITILGLADSSHLLSKIPIFFNSARTDNSSCGYWSFTSINGWSLDGCELKEILVNKYQQVTVCECSHLTHFGYFINSYMHETDNVHERNLTLITVIGSLFSLVGAVGIFATAALFPTWRKKLSSKILIHFTASIALEMFLIIFINSDDRLLSIIVSKPLICVVMGAIVHYSVLVMYFWMLIIAYLQFKRYVTVFNFSVSHLLLKSTIFAWGVPLLLVTTVLIADHTLYLPIYKDELKFCYPTGWALYFGVLTPIALIVLVDSIVFLSVLVSLQVGLSKSVSMTEATKFQMRLSQVRLCAFLFFTLGLTWIFGFLSKIHPNCYSAFSYLFCITATIQGMVLFLYFIVLDPNVRVIWTKYLRRIITYEQ